MRFQNAEIPELRVCVYIYIYFVAVVHMYPSENQQLIGPETKQATVPFPLQTLLLFQYCMY